MIRKALCALILCAVTACSAPSNTDCPREGGIGGTGGCLPTEPLN